MTDTKIKSRTAFGAVAFLASAFSLASAAFAATPVAVWDGDFSQDNASQNGWRIDNRNETHAADWSSVTLDRDNQGLMINSESGKSGMTVLVKYSGLSNSASAHRVLAASCVTAAYKYDRTGITLKSDGKLVGLWNSSTSASSDIDNGMASGSIASSGVMAFTYGNGGTYLYYGSDTASISSTAAWGASGLKSSSDSDNSSIYGAAIGGMCAEASRSGYEAAKGMTISGIAVFDRVLSVEEMTGYIWPSEVYTLPIQKDVLGASVRVSAIKTLAKFAAQNYSAVDLEVEEGMTIIVDEPFDDNIHAVLSSGSITLSAESQPDASYFANVDFSGVKGGLLRSWLTPGVVGLNFSKNYGNVVSDALVTSVSWVGTSGANGNSTALFADGLTKVTWSSGGVYSYNYADNEQSSFIHGYLDDGSNRGNGVEICVANVPYETYDVIIYASTDTADARFLAKTVNGTAYTVVSSGIVSAGDAAWGMSRQETPVYGVNAMRIKNLSGPLSIYGGARSGSNRGGIAAIQIMPAESEDEWVAPESISINFYDIDDDGLSSDGDAKIGLGNYAVAQDLWNNLVGTNNASLSQLKCILSNGDEIIRKSMTATVSKTRGSWYCSELSYTNDILRGYIDDNDAYPTPTVTVTGIPYDKYRVVVYHSTDTTSIPFGYDLVNGIPFTGVSGHTSVGTANWGDSGPSQSAKPLEEGVNVLVTPVLPNNAEKTLTVTGHRISGIARGCIAAIQIFDASGDNSELDVATNRVYSTYKDGPWVFPDDIAVADPAKFGGMIIGTNAVSQSLGDTVSSTISATALASIPEAAAGTLVSLGVEGGHSVHAKYYGNGVFSLSYDNAGAVVTNKPIDVADVHIWTLTFDANSGAAFYKDGVKVIEASSIKWTAGGTKKITGSVEFGARHDQTDPLTGSIIYAARTDYGNAQAINAGNVISRVYSDQECPGVSELATLAEKSELFTHLVGYGDTEGLLALMPHRTSTYEYGGWHCPLDAHFADGEYVDGLTTVFNPVVQNLPGVSTNAAAASVLAQIPRTAAGVIANITVVNGNSTHCVFARSNGDGTVSLGWENDAKHKTSGILDGWDDVHVWTLVSHETDGCKLYRDGELVLEDAALKFSGYKAGTSIMFGNATNSRHPLDGIKVYAVHTDFGASSEIFSTAEENAAAVFDSFDFMEELAGCPLGEKVEAFVRYTETGVAYEPPPVFDPENDEVAETCVLRISEIMPKPTDALNRGKLEGMDVNGLESGWVEVENTSPDKWADLGDYKFIRSNRGKKTGQADYGNFPSVMIAPGSRYVFYTSERYSNSADMTVSAWAEADESGVKPKLYGADLKDILVWPDKVNPKKSPFVRLIYTPTDAIVDTVVVPSDVPEGCSIIVGEAGDGEATKRWLCSTPTRGRANTATEGLVRIGPNAGPLYEIAGGKKHDSANEFARLAPPAVPGEDYEITFSFNPVMHPTVAGGFRDEDAITNIVLVYRTDLTNAERRVSVDLSTDVFDSKDWGHTYTASIPAGDLPAPGHLIQWKFIATDASGNEWTSPSFNNPDDGYEWYGTIVEPDPDTQMSATLPTWHMFVDEASRAQMDYDKDDSRYTLPNGARVAIYDSSTSNYYDYVRIDLRGHTSAGFTKKGHGLRFAKAHPLTMTDIVTGETIEEIRKTSLISEFADPSYMRQMIAFWLWRKMGNLVPFDFPVRCNLNGEFYQLAFNSERFTDELIEDVYGLDKYGYGYKNVGTLKSGSSTTAGKIEKKTPDDENESDITVLQNELRSKITAAQQVSSSPDGGSDGLDNAALTKFVVEKFDLPAWLNYLASARITHEMDDVWANVCIYYDNPDMKEGVRGKGTWMPLGYDFNLSFGQWYFIDIGGTRFGLTSTNDWYKSHPLYGGNRVRAYRNSSLSGNPMDGNDGYESVLQSAKFRRLYLRRLRTLMDQELKEPGTAEASTPFMAKMREMADLMRTDAALDLAKWPNNGSDHLYVTHSVTNTAKSIGYGSNLNAGIPEAQSPIETLAPNISISNLTALDAAEAEALGVAGQLYDTEVVVIRNDNAEVVDMSGWRLAFSVDFTFPAGTVCDANDSIYIVADRRAYVTSHSDELTDQVIVGNAKFTGAGPVALYDADGALVYSAIPQTDELKYLRLHSFYGNTLDGGDTGEWFTLTNISDTVTLDLLGVTVCFLKQGDPEEGTAHCHVTLENKKGKGIVEPLKSWTASQADYSDKGWEKIQNNKQQITIYDKYGSVCQSLMVTQKSFKLAYGNGGYLVCDSTDTSVAGDLQWHEALYELPNNGESSESFDADSQETANELIANAKPALSDDDVAAGLETQYLKVVAQPVEGEVGKYKAVVVVNPETVEVPVMAQIEDGETSVDPLTVASDEDGQKVTVGVSNAKKGLWYGFVWTDSLGDTPFENDVESFTRATSTSVKIESKAEAAKQARKAFFRVRVEPAKPTQP